MSTTLKTKIAPLLAAVALLCAGAAHADPLLVGSTYASLVGSNAGMVNNGIDLGQPITMSSAALTFGTDPSQPGAAWTGFGSVSNLSAPTATKLALTAVSSNRCQAAGSCNNQSDDVGSAVRAVPEPETYALLAAGLGAIGFVAGRRRRY